MDMSLPGSSVQGIFQARVLEWVAISFSKGSSQPKDQTQVSHIAGRHFTVWITREAFDIHKNCFVKTVKVWGQSMSTETCEMPVEFTLVGWTRVICGETIAKISPGHVEIRKE